MTEERFQLTSTAALLYEEQKVPAIFGPLARATLAMHEVSPQDNVLDVACGTGIVARAVRELFGDEPVVTGIDVNEAMITTGRDICERESVDVDFRSGDAANTPFRDGEFTFIICQQGRQYFPDENAALIELRRIAAHRCRFVLTVWSRPSPLFLALADSLRTHVGAKVAKQSLAPFSWAGADTIVDRMTETGYSRIDVRELEVERVLNEPEDSITKEIMSNPVGPAVAALGETVIDAVVADTLAATTRFQHNNKLVIPQHTYLISATAN